MDFFLFSIIAFNEDRSSIVDDCNKDGDVPIMDKTRLSNKLCKLYLSKSENTYDYENQQQLIDDKCVGSLNNPSMYYVLVGDFSSSIKEQLYNVKIYEVAFN